MHKIIPYLMAFVVYGSAFSSYALSQAQIGVKVAREQTSANAFPAVKALIEQAQIPQAIQLLDSYLSEHENDADYFNLMGILCLQQKMYAQAASAFERVVLIQSDNAGAWLDLAIANAEAGNIATANQFFDYVESALHPTPTIQKLIKAYRARLKIREQQIKPWHFAFEYQLGHDSNANSGLSEKFIFISVLGENKKFDLDPMYIARPDFYKNTRIEANYKGEWQGNQINWGAAATHHSFVKEHAFSTTQLMSNASISRRSSIIDFGASMNTERFLLGGKTLLNNGSFALFAEKVGSICHTSLSLELERRRYVVNTQNATSNTEITNSLDANTVWQNMASSCGVTSSYGPIEIAFVARHGNDQPNSVRTGGATDRKELITKISWRTLSNWHLDLSAHYARAKDAQGFSVLLENNAARQMFRRGYRLQLSYPIANDWLFFFNWDKNVNDSNLSIFRQTGRNINLGLRMNF